MIDIDTKDLKIGMYVSHLDRPWLETSFLFQGFLIENDKQIEQVRRVSKTVKIDEEKSLQSLSFEPFKPSTAKSKVAVEQQPSNPKAGQSNKQRFEEEMAKACEVYDETSVSLHKVLNNFRLNNYITLPEIKSCVQGVMKSVMRNPNTLLLLSHMRSKRPDTVTHSINICIFSTLFGRYLQLTEEQLLQLSIAALMHDVGEAKVPKPVLDKFNVGLTPEEKMLLEQHTQQGAEMLRKIPEIPTEVAEVAYSHHERVDGTGYPRGLKGAEISFMSKIIAIVDAYEKETNAANIKSQLSCSDALKAIYAMRETSFDSELVESFIKCLGIYPVGTVVQLNNGSTGIVIGMKPDQHLLPTVMVIRDHTGEIKQPPQVINLDRFRDHEGKPLLMINKVIQPNEVDIDLGEYIVRELGASLSPHPKFA